MTTDFKLQPTGNTGRINSMDIIRGVALCGILLMNITGFGLFKSYEDPTINGGATGWNFKVWWINSMFFEGTMRGMFSLLFGAGILIFTSRSKENAGTVTDVFFRRLMWMVLFGIIHCYLLLWHGEILYCYGIVGMFAFSFRHLQPKKLFIAAAVLLSLSTLLNVNDFFRNKKDYNKATAAVTKQKKGETLSKEETAALEKWNGIVKERKPSKAEIKEGIDAMHKGYFSIVSTKAGVNQFMQTIFLYRYGFFDALSMMLLGMAFFKSGILKAQRSNRFYRIMALIGYAVGLSVNYFEVHTITFGHFSVLAFDKSYLTYEIGRVGNTFGHVALIMLFIKAGWLPFLQKALAAVGQMAFTNYIMHSVICNFIFLGYGFGLFGMLQRYQLYYVVFGVWILQLILSPIWLRYFRFGPLEWGWRSLTYWERQPFRRLKNEA